LSKLRSLGLGSDEEFKLVALREFVWRLSIRRSRDVTPGPGRIQSETVVLQSMGIMPQTVLLYQEPPKEGSASTAVPAKAPYTIADALMDASMAIDDASAKRKRTAAANPHKSRLAPSSNGNSAPTTNAAPSPRLLATSPTDTRGGSSRDSSVAGREDDARSSKRSIRHQSSALSLLDRRDSNKTAPETSTTSTHAIGQVESGPYTQPFSAKTAKLAPTAAEEAPQQETPPRTRHTYEGHNPSIIKMLDAIALDTYPTDLPEFGPLVTPVTGFRTTMAGGSGDKHSSKTWQPKGGFVATFAEHKGAINRVVASPDHVFFITGGDDGTVRVWDSSRLERNITHRSKQVYRHGNNGGRVVALCFVEATHTFISTCTDGSVHLVRVDIRLSHDGTLRYGRLQPVGQFLINQPDEHAVWVDHFKTETHSVMMLATNRSRIMAVNLRNMEVLYELHNPVHHGTPTCFCIDRRRHWLCVGTSHGVLDLWDLRFHTRVKAMGLPGRTAVYRLSVHPARGRGRWICVSGGCGPGEVTIWDIERSTCREVLRPSGAKELTGAYEFWDVDGDKPEGMLSRFATAIEPATDTIGADGGVRAMLVGSPDMEPLDDDDDPRTKPTSADPSSLREIRGAFVITAGADKKLRFWDLQHPYNSITFSGLRPEDPKPVYANTQERSLSIFTERVVRAPSSSGGGGGGGSERRRDSKSGDGGRPTSGRGASSRSMLVSVQQQTLMRGHLDAITDVAVLDVPYSVVVSVDRLGVIFVFR
jgi:phosphoinositide-3-kinase regulatory subunit 4